MERLAIFLVALIMVVLIASTEGWYDVYAFVYVYG